MTPMVRNVVIIVALFLVSNLGSTINKYINNRYNNEISLNYSINYINNNLQQINDEIKQNFKNMQNQEAMRAMFLFDRVYAKDKIINFVLRQPYLKVSDFTNNQAKMIYKKNMKEVVIQMSCNIESIKNILNDGYVLSYVVYGNDEQELYRQEINKNSCLAR